MAVPFSNTKLRVPRGFQNLLEGLAKEVLKNQPENIHNFAAIYFNNLIKIREEQGTDPAEIGAKHEDRFYNNKAFSKAGNMGDVSNPRQQEAATTIQAAVRGHQAREDLKTTEAEKARGEEAAARVQDAGEGDSGGAVESKADVKESELDIDLEDPETVKAATKIQASFRGYQTRKTLKEKDGTSPSTEPPGKEVSDGVTEEAPPVGSKEEQSSEPTDVEQEAVDIDLSDPEVEKAAVKIQGGFKILIAKREVEERRRAKEETVEAAPEEEEEKMPDEDGEGVTAAAPSTEEEVDIDLEDPEVGKAAEKIQATFRGFQTRKKLKEETEPTQEATTAEVVSKSPTEAETGDGGEVLMGHIDPSDPQVNIAAAKIQAGYKGMKVRKEMKSISVDAIETDQAKAEGEPKAAPDGAAKRGLDEVGEETMVDTTTEQTDGGEADPEKEEEEAIDIDLNDPEVEQAAVKIQAGFKGFKARKELKNKEDESTDKPSGEEGEEETPSTEKPEAPPTSKEDLPPVNEDTPPVKEDTPPVEEDMLPVEEDTPPVEEDTPPVKEDMPSVKEDTHPVKEDTPPVKEDTPPVKGDTSQVEKDTPPAEGETVPAGDDRPPTDKDTQPGAGQPAEVVGGQEPSAAPSEGDAPP